MPSILSLISIALIVCLSLVNGFDGTNVPNSWNFGVGAEDALPAVSESNKRSPKPPLSSTHSPPTPSLNASLPPSSSTTPPPPPSSTTPSPSSSSTTAPPPPSSTAPPPSLPSTAPPPSPSSTTSSLSPTTPPPPPSSTAPPPSPSSTTSSLSPTTPPPPPYSTAPPPSPPSTAPPPSPSSTTPSLSPTTPPPPPYSTTPPTPALLPSPFSNALSLKTPSSAAAVFSLQGVEEAWEIYPYLQEGSRDTKLQDGGDGMAGSPGNAPSDHSSTTVDLFRGRKLLCRESTKSHKWTSKHKPSSCTHPRVSPSVFSPPVGATGLNLSPSVSAQPHELSITINNVTYVTCGYVCIGTFAGLGSLIGIVWKIIKYIMAMQSTQPQPDDAGAHAGAGAGAAFPMVITIDRRTA